MKKIWMTSISFLLTVSVGLLFCTLVMVFAESAQSSSNTKITAELADILQTTDNTETVSVCLWTTDIDHDGIERSVKAELGYAKNELMAQAAHMNTLSMLNEQASLSFSFEDTVQDYIQATQQERQRLQDMTNQYIASQRRFAREAYRLQRFLNGSSAIL